MRPPVRRIRVLAREPDRPFETAYPASWGRAIGRRACALLDDREPYGPALRMQLDDGGVLTLPVGRLGPSVRQDLARHDDVAAQRALAFEGDVAAHRRQLDIAGAHAATGDLALVRRGDQLVAADRVEVEIGADRRCVERAEYLRERHVSRQAVRVEVARDVLDADRARRAVELAAAVHVHDLELASADARIDVRIARSVDDDVDRHRGLRLRTSFVRRIGGGHDAYRAVRIGNERHAQTIERFLVGRGRVRLDHDAGAVLALDAHVPERVVDLQLLERLARGLHLD